MVAVTDVFVINGKSPPKTHLEHNRRWRFYGIKLFAQKKFQLSLLVLALTVNAHAGLAGWLTSSARSWNFVQETGGIRISEPVEREGKLVLPVEYDPTGVGGVTQRPTRLNSGLVVRKIQSTRSGDNQIVIRIVTQVAEQDSDPGRIHYADLEDFPAGPYTVYYEEAGDLAKFLGRIQVN